MPWFTPQSGQRAHRPDGGETKLEDGLKRHKTVPDCEQAFSSQKETKFKMETS